MNRNRDLDNKLLTELTNLLCDETHFNTRDARDAWLLELPGNARNLITRRHDHCKYDLTFIIDAVKYHQLADGRWIILILTDALLRDFKGLMIGKKLESLYQKIERNLAEMQPATDKDSSFKSQDTRETANGKRVKVFISHATEDCETAKKLYDDLKRAGLEPWMGKKDILTGQNWESEILRTIRESSYFLALLSSKSVSKRGYVQKELKTALDILDKSPESEIFLLPVRLDECKPSDEKLEKLQRCDLFPSYEQGLEKILSVLCPSASDCPPALGNLIQTNQDCARIIQRYELVNEIKRYLLETPAPKPNHVVLSGQPLSGKTNILSRLSEVIGDEYLPLMISAQGSPVSKLNYFLYDLISQLISNFIKYSKLPADFGEPDLNDFEGKERSEFYKYWNYLCQVAGKKQLIVMFDEIERLLDQPDELNEQILPFLDNFVGNPDNGYFILAGSERILYSNNKEFSLIIAKGRPFNVGYLEQETVSSFFSTLFDFEGDTLKRIMALWDGHPRFLQDVYEEIVSIITTRIPGKQKVETSDIELLVKKVIGRTKSLLWHLLQRLSDKEQSVIKLISQKPFDPVNGSECCLDELFELAKQEPDFSTDENDLKEGIRKLEAREWIEWKNENEGLFRFKLGILLLWMQKDIN